MNRTTVFLLLLGLVLGMAWSAQGAIVLEDTFDDGVLDPAWTVTLNNVSGWTYEESGTNLTVTDITTSVGDPVWGKTILSRTLPADQTDFSVDFEFSWIAEEGPSTYQALYITLYGSTGEIIAFAGYLSTLGSIGQKVVVVTGGDSNVDHDQWGTDYQPDSNYYASYTLPQSGSATIRISRVGDTMQFFWDNTLLLAPQITNPLHGIDIQFWHENIPDLSQSFGTESVDLIRVREASYPGDVTGDKSVNVSDVVKSLQITAGILPTENISLASDVNKDNRIGLEEALYGLRELAGEPGPAIVDRSNISFEDNLLTRVQAGEWTLGEGLVATLKLMIGEIDAEGVLRHPELLSYDGTGIMMIANEYLEDGPDAEAKAEISRLLSFMVFSNEQLEAMAGITATPIVQQHEAIAGVTATPTGQQLEIATAGSVVDCRNFFEYAGEEIPQGVGDCLEVRNSQKLTNGTYRVFAPAPSFPDVGWENKHYDLALEAMEDAVPKFVDLFSAVGRAPPSINVIFLVINKPYGHLGVLPLPGQPCGIFVFTNSQGIPDDFYKQNLAAGVAMCFETEMFPEHHLSFEISGWWYYGLARYLSNVVYKYSNYEWGPPPDKRDFLDSLTWVELDTTLFDRRNSNFIFFQYLENIKGNKAFVDLIKFLPTSGGRAEQEIKLAQYPDMEYFFHDFAKALTDRNVMDTSGEAIPYEMNDRNRLFVTITEPVSIKGNISAPFSVFREILLVEEGKRADLDFREEKGPVRESTRSVDDIHGTEWKAEVPPKLPPPEKCWQDTYLVVTTVESQRDFDLEINKVEDSPCIFGVWVVDNATLWFKPSVFTLLYIKGQIRATFHKNGTVDVVYDNWEYRVFDWDYGLDVGGVILNNYEEITYIINAQGTTTYELDGDYIDFGHSSESDFLSGIEKIHHIKQWTPSGHIPDLDDEYERSPRTYRGVFTGFKKYKLSGGILRLILWNKEYILHQVGFVDE